MIKYTILLLNVLALLLARVFFIDSVDVKISMPQRVSPGEEFTVECTISKGAIAGVGHLKLEVPAGFSATVVDAKGADFRYLSEDNVVKFTWISLPSDAQFTVSFKVKADTSLMGKQKISGKFSYVLNNEKQTFMIPEAEILVGEEALATATTTTEPTPTTTTEPATTTTTGFSTIAKTAADISVSRSIIGEPEAGMEFTVEVKVKKTGIKGFGRVQEILPPGFTAISLSNKGGTFSFADQKMKIIWDNLPADEEFSISYRVLVSENVSGGMFINGSFSYVENDDPKKIDLEPTAISVKPKTTLATVTTPTTATSTGPTTTTSVPSPEKKISFKVQICALSKLNRASSYFESKFSMGEKVNMEFHEGWRKYIVGKHSQYTEARNHRENVRTKGIEGPFVTAYNNGKRITVQEGLMIAQQQWIP